MAERDQISDVWAPLLSSGIPGAGLALSVPNYLSKAKEDRSIIRHILPSVMPVGFGALASELIHKNIVKDRFPPMPSEVLGLSHKETRPHPTEEQEPETTQQQQQPPEEPTQLSDDELRAQSQARSDREYAYYKEVIDNLPPSYKKLYDELNEQPGDESPFATDHVNDADAFDDASLDSWMDAVADEGWHTDGYPDPEAAAKKAMKLGKYVRKKMHEKFDYTNKNTGKRDQQDLGVVEKV